MPKKLYSLFWKWLNDPFKFIDSKSCLLGLSTFPISAQSFLIQNCIKLKVFPRIMCKLSKERPTCHMILLFCYFPLNQFRETLTSILLTWEGFSIDQCWALEWELAKQLRYGLFFNFNIPAKTVIIGTSKYNNYFI